MNKYIDNIEKLFMNFGLDVTATTEDYRTIIIDYPTNKKTQLKLVSLNSTTSIFKFIDSSKKPIFIDKLKEEILNSIQKINFCDFDLKKAFIIRCYIKVDNEKAYLIFSFNQFNRISIPLNFLSNDMANLNFNVSLDAENIVYDYKNKNFNNFENIIIYLYRNLIKEKLPSFDLTLDSKKTLEILRLLEY